MGSIPVAGVKNTIVTFCDYGIFSILTENHLCACTKKGSHFCHSRCQLASIRLAEIVHKVNLTVAHFVTMVFFLSSRRTIFVLAQKRVRISAIAVVSLLA